MSEPFSLLDHDLEGQIRGKMRGNALEVKVTTRFKNNDRKRFFAPNSSVSERFSLLGHDLQGQIRGQMTGNALEAKFTIRLNK